MKLKIIKEIIEPYAIHKLKQALIDDNTEIEIKRIMHDNNFKYKPKYKNFKFNTNKIKNIQKKIKELQKK